MDDWYNLSQEDIHKHGGCGLLREYFSNSPFAALKAVYPAHDWNMPWKFGHVPQGFWAKLENQRQFFDWIFTQLGFQVMDDWYSVTISTIHKLGGKRLMNAYYSN